MGHFTKYIYIYHLRTSLKKEPKTNYGEYYHVKSNNVLTCIYFNEMLLSTVVELTTNTCSST